MMCIPASVLSRTLIGTAKKAHSYAESSGHADHFMREEVLEIAEEDRAAESLLKDARPGSGLPANSTANAASARTP